MALLEQIQDSHCLQSHRQPFWKINKQFVYLSIVHFARWKNISQPTHICGFTFLPPVKDGGGALQPYLMALTSI